MAVALTITPAFAATTSGTSITIDNIAPTGTNRLLCCTYSISTNQPNRTFTSMQKGTTDFTTTHQNVVNSYYMGGARSLVNPSTTSETVTAVVSGATDGAVMGVTGFEGVDQTTPTDTAQTSNGDNTDPTALSVTTAADDYVWGWLACGWNGAPAFVLQGDGTEQARLTENFAVGAIMYHDNASTPTSVEWGAGLGDDSAYAMGGVNINASVAGGGRIMSSLANDGGLAGHGGLAGQGGGLAG